MNEAPKATMKAVGVYRYLPIADPDSLVDVELKTPAAIGRDLLVHVKAVSVNPVDVKQRAPKDKVEQEARILGWDVAGVVVEAGPECTLFRPGDEVYYAGSLIRPGGNSEYHLVDERIVGVKPASLDYAEAAALPLTAITAWEGLFHRLGVGLTPAENEGKTLLVIGAAGGVGSIAIQLAKYAGLRVIGTASREESIAWARSMGADEVIDHHEPFLPQLQAIGLEGVDYIFCLNSTEQHWPNMAASISPQGKICSIVETKHALDLNLLMSKSATFVWELMFTRSMFQTSDMIRQHELLNEISGLIDQGVLRSTLTTRLRPIHAANLREAHALLETGSTIGKIVIEDFEETV